ncbi:uncharacterized protein LOC143238425 isoform X2 [Tachypleus tridentatus]
MMNASEKQSKNLTAKSTLRRFTEHVKNGNIEKIEKFLVKGLDPNFHCPDSQETPLTLSTTLRHPRHVIMALINGGARLDFTTPDGRTALHRAVEANNIEALKTLLDLGASPNYKDNRKLTPLYYSVVYDGDHQLTELLLYEHAVLGTADLQGWQEIHQACKHGRVQHLELLLFYGADLNCQNASGNTALHICAVNDQQECARVLLFRGVDKEALNYANQDPYQVAVIASNLHLAELIKNHKADDVIPYRDIPRFNPRRRPSSTVVRTTTDNRSVAGAKPSSEAATEETVGEPKNNATNETEVSERNIHPGATCVCVQSYSAGSPGHLPLNSGDYVEVVGISDCGLLEGRLANGQEGFFPSSCVREIKARTENSATRQHLGGRDLPLRRVNSMPRKWKMNGTPRTVVLHKGKKGFGFVLRGAKATSPLMERQRTYAWPSLQYLDDVDRGGVADQAGMKKGDFVLEINGHNVTQATHDQVVSIIRKSGDLVAMTVVTVNNPPGTRRPLNQRQCATVPRRLSFKKAPAPPKRDPGTTLSFGRARARSMVTGLAEIDALEDPLQDYYFESRSARSSFIVSGEEGSSHSSAEQQSLECRLQETTSATNSSGDETITAARDLDMLFDRIQPCSFLKRFYSCPDLAKMYNCAVSNGEIYICNRSQSCDNFRSLNGKTSVHSWACSPHNYKKSGGGVKEAATELKLYSSSVGLNSKIVFSDERKLIDSKTEETNFIKHKQLADANNEQSLTYERNAYWSQPARARNEETRLGEYAETMVSGQQFPPPSQPPPPLPPGQVVQVDISKVQGEYANVCAIRNYEVAPMSSFRPGDSAKLYASPESVITVGYKPFHHSRITHHTRLQSVPPREVRHQTSSESESSGDTSGFYGSLIHSQKQRSSSSRYFKVKGILGNQSRFGSPNHFPVLSPKPHDHFPSGLEFDSSEEEDLSSFLNKAGKLSTFGKSDERAMNYNSWKFHSEGEKLRIVMPQVDSSQSSPYGRYRLNPQSFDSKNISFQISNQPQLFYSHKSSQPSSVGYSFLNKNSQFATSGKEAHSTYQSHLYSYADLHKNNRGRREHFNKRNEKSTFEPVQNHKPDKLVHEHVNRSSTLPNRRSFNFEINEQGIISARKTIRPSRSFPNDLAKEDRKGYEHSPKDEIYVSNTNGYINNVTEKESKYSLQFRESLSTKRYQQLPVEEIFERARKRPQQRSLVINSPSSKSSEMKKNSSSGSLLQFLPPPPEFTVFTSPDDHLAAMISPPPEFSDSATGLGTDGKKRFLSQSNYPDLKSNFIEHCASNYIFKENDFYCSVINSSGEKKCVSSGDQQTPAQDCSLKQYHMVPDTTLSVELSSGSSTQKSEEKEFRRKLLQDWSITDVSEWLDSLFLSEYKSAFLEAGINGAKLANMDNNDLVGLGVKPVGHRLNIERAMKRYVKKD